ncbi:uncharacterized protein LOC122275008 isoform X2 [Carya illinoinensis]|uniref:uncharacterized protein LOC122275008 isoform X2 n=1 Tax=Carya illinoinensis TaxID=32201 RepID=UPI001C718117|nr:uncharacterized protein LOC122275008 isoform X2 [Carya illinoinensis]
MGFDKEELDLVLVPAGLLFMLAYHFFFLYRYFHRPHTTFMGYDNNDKRAWVKSIMEAKQGKGCQRGSDCDQLQHNCSDLLGNNLSDSLLSHWSLDCKLFQHLQKRTNLRRHKGIHHFHQVLVPNTMPSVQTDELKLVDWTEKKFWIWQWPILALRSLLGICTLRGLTKYPQPNKVKGQTGLQAHFNSPS